MELRLRRPFNDKKPAVHASLVFIFLLSSSCALLNPNPNRAQAKETSIPVLETFTTDYCSEWPDGNMDDPKRWASCCFNHDIHYWIGGTEEQRKASDFELKECVKTTGESLGSFLMYTGVRIGGRPGNASWAWGYGWTLDRKYFELSNEDKINAAKLLKESKHNKDADEKKIINTFIEKNLY